MMPWNNALVKTISRHLLWKGNSYSVLYTVDLVQLHNVTKTMWIPDHLTSHFKTVGINMPPIYCFTFLRRLSTRFCSVVVDFLLFATHKSTKVQARRCLARRPVAFGLPVHPNGVQCGLGQGSVYTIQVLLQHALQTNTPWTSFCTHGHCHAGTGDNGTDS